MANVARIAPTMPSSRFPKHAPGFFARVCRNWMLTLWIMGFTALPANIFTCQPRFRKTANAFAILQAGIIIAVHVYVVYDYWKAYQFTSFITVTMFVTDNFNSICIMEAVRTGWKSGTAILNLVVETDQQFGALLRESDFSKVVAFLVIWSVYLLLLAILYVIHGDIPLYLTDGVINCENRICYVFTGLYYAFYRLHVLWVEILVSLVLFTAVMVTRMLDIMRSSNSVVKRGDLCGVLRIVHSLHRYVNLLDKQFSSFNLLFAVNCITDFVIPPYALGKTFAEDHTINWLALTYLVAATVMLVTVGTVFVRLQESMQLAVSMLRSCASKHADHRPNDAMAKETERPQTDIRTFTLWGIILSRDYCLGVAGAICINVILFSELGHGHIKPDKEWFIGQLGAVLVNESITMGKHA